MITNLLVDLVDTVITLPFRPRDKLPRRLGLKVPYGFDYIAHSICINNPGINSKEYISRLAKELTAFGDNGNKSLESDISSISNVWAEIIENAKFIDGATDSINYLRKNGFKLTVISNTTPPTWEIIERLHLDQLFDSIILSCDVGFLKPDPRIFRVAIESIGATRRESCVVGDKWSTDMRGAIDADLLGILVNNNLSLPTTNGSSTGVIAAIPSIKFLPSVIDTLTIH